MLYDPFGSQVGRLGRFVTWFSLGPRELRIREASVCSIARYSMSLSVLSSPFLP